LIHFNNVGKKKRQLQRVTGDNLQLWSEGIHRSREFLLFLITRGSCWGDHEEEDEYEHSTEEVSEGVAAGMLNPTVGISGEVDI
jgi:hypothetical protein